MYKLIKTVSLTIILLTLPNQALASKVWGRFDLIVPEAQDVVDALQDVNDLEVTFGGSTLNRRRQGDCSFPLNYTPNGGARRQIDNAPDDMNIGRFGGVEFQWDFPAINNISAGDVFSVECHAISNVTGGVSFTKDNDKIEIKGRNLFRPIFINNGHRVAATKDNEEPLNFRLAFRNGTIDNNFNAPSVPVVLSNLRIFTDVDFGQTSFDELDEAVTAFLNIDQEGVIFDDSGNLLRVPNGTEIDIDTLLLDFPGWNPITKQLTITEEEILLPSFELQNILGGVFVFGQSTINDPDSGILVSNFTVGHGVSEIVSTPESSNMGLVITAILGLIATSSKFSHSKCISYLNKSGQCPPEEQ